MTGTIEAVAEKAILEAGELIRRHIGQVAGSMVSVKGPSDYVTVIDKECERLITEAIRKNFPDHHIMAEESANEGLQPGYTWVIDPVDGTTNFIHGFPFVAVSIAVCLDKKPVAGFVLDPVRNELFSAKKDEGAWLNGVRLPRRKRVEMDRALVATGIPSRAREYMDPYLVTFKAIAMEVSGIRRAGAAALDLAYLAAGRVDGFWEIGLKAWDIAAGALLIMETGGSISDFSGEDNFLFNGNVTAGVEPVYGFLLKQTQEHLALVCA
ncbi:MAG: inositol monophosphatase family protein [Syntrophobacteraceae bacterium]|nr:inositol monophosphatase family protein [Syntrophobacteraceae bacterium]